MNNWIKLTDNSGDIWVNLSAGFSMKRYSPPPGGNMKPWTRIFGSALGIVAIPDPATDSMKTVPQFLYTDVAETPEAILAELTKRIN